MSPEEDYSPEGAVSLGCLCQIVEYTVLSSYYIGIIHNTIQKKLCFIKATLHVATRLYSISYASTMTQIGYLMVIFISCETEKLYFELLFFLFLPDNTFNYRQ